MRLLHVFSAPQSAFAFLDKQLQFMIENGCEVHLIIPNDGFYSKKLMEREPNVKFHFVSLKRKISVLNDIKSFISVFFLILKIKPDILHLHTPKASFIGALAGRLSFQKNIIYQMHGLVSGNGNSVKKNLVYFLEKYTCSLATKVFAVSPSLLSFAIEKGFCSKNKISVIGNGTINGIDWERRFNINNLENRYKYVSNGQLKGKFIVGFVGRKTEDKGIEDFLYVVSSLRKRFPVMAIIAGKNEMENRFDALLRKYDLLDKDVHLKVFDRIIDPENIICHFDVLLFPTKREGFGLVATEANALGIPVVAYDIPGVKDAIENNVTGKLVPYPDRDGLKEAVYEYYKNEKERKEHGQNGVKRVQKLFGQNALWQNILKVYKDLVNA